MMKKKRLILPLVFICLVLVAWWLLKSDTESTLAGPLTNFAIADTAAVDRIFIADKNGGVADLKRTSDGWTVNGLPAKDFQVDLLLKTFKLVELRTPVPKSAEATVLRVMAGSARKVEIYQGGKKPVKIWWIGHSTKDHFGTYMVLEIPGKGKSSVPFAMGMAGFTGVLNTRFTTDIDSWRSSRVTYYPTLSDVTKVQVEIPGSSQEGFTVTYAGGDHLALFNNMGRQMPMDTARVQDLMLAIRNGSFEGFERNLPKEARDSVLSSRPWYILTITSKTGVQRIPFYRKDPEPGERSMDFQLLTEDKDRMYALLSDTALVVVQRYWWDQVTRPLGTLTAREPRQH